MTILRCCRHPRDVGRHNESAYAVRMARVNVYLPDALAAQAKAADLNVSKLTQEGLTAALAADRTTAWLCSVAALGTTRVSHEDVLQAVHEAKSEFDESP